MKIVILTVLCLVVSAILSQESGARVIFSGNGVNAVIRKYTPDYAAVILSTQIPAIHVTQKIAIIGDVDVNIDNLKITKIDFGDFGARCEEPNVVILGTNTASVSFQLNWSYRQKNWPHASGHGTADGFAEKTILMGHVIAAVKDGRFVFKASRIVLDIGKSKITIKGGFSGWLMNLLESLFRTVIRNRVENAVEKVIAEKIDQTLNEIIQKTNFTPELKVGKEPNVLNWIQDFTIPDGQLFMNKDFLSVAPRFSSRAIHPQPSQLKAIDLPTKPTALDRDVNAFISDYMFNTFFEALHQGNQLHYTVLPEQVPPESPFKFNTTAFKAWFPAFHEKFPNAPFRLDVETLSAPTLQFSPQGMGAVANISIVFSALDAQKVPTKGFKVFATIGADYKNVTAKSSKAGTLITMGGQMTGSVNMGLIESYVGDNLNVTKFKGTFEVIFVKVLLTKLNKMLAEGALIDLNTLLPGLFIDDLQLFLNEKFININTNATYVPKEIIIPPTNDMEMLKMYAFMLEKMESMSRRINELEDDVSHCHAK